jgi:hypothetical protein
MGKRAVLMLEDAEGGAAELPCASRERIATGSSYWSWSLRTRIPWKICERSSTREDLAVLVSGSPSSCGQGRSSVGPSLRYPG